MILQLVIRMVLLSNTLEAINEYANREDIVVATKFLPRTEEDIKNNVTGQQHIQNLVNKSLDNLQNGLYRLIHLSHVGSQYSNI